MKHNAAYLEGYIICPNRRNAPRLSVEICERACRCKDTCEAYQLFLSAHRRQQTALLSVSDQGVTVYHQ